MSDLPTIALDNSKPISNSAAFACQRILVRCAQAPASMMAITAIFLFLSAVAIGQTPTTKATKTDEVADKKSDAKLKPKFRTESVRGKVVWLNEALSKRFNISTADDAAKRSLAIETEKGELLPLLEDLRGRSFRTDETLMGKPVELLVRRYEKHPMLQIIRMYDFKDKQKYEVDYWCDVCAIIMFEKGFCACCQDDNRIRRRIVKNGVTAERD